MRSAHRSLCGAALAGMQPGFLTRKHVVATRSQARTAESISPSSPLYIAPAAPCTAALNASVPSSLLLRIHSSVAVGLNSLSMLLALCKGGDSVSIGWRGPWDPQPLERTLARAGVAPYLRSAPQRKRRHRHPPAGTPVAGRGQRVADLSGTACTAGQCGLRRRRDGNGRWRRALRNHDTTNC